MIDVRSLFPHWDGHTYYCPWCEAKYDDRNGPHVCEQKTRGDAAMAKMKRYDGRDESIITCACRASFSWEGSSDRLYPWVLAHAPHMEAK